MKAFTIVALAVGIAIAHAAETKPNLILILADDLGYGDLGCYGSTTIATPRLDRMAREGARFTNAYSAAPFCSPSRAGLLTGRLPARCGLPYVLFPAEHHGLPPAEITIAEALKQNGYATACVGKWHLGWDAPFRPQRQGFDVFFGAPYSNDSNEWPVGTPFMQVMGLRPFPLIDGDKVVDAPADQAQLTRRYTERAVAFIRENRARPFFLYLPHTMPHVPQYATAPFAGKSKGGLYGDAVEEIDWSMGVILDALRELQIAERTLVVFTSDNGAPARGNVGAASGTKGTQGTGKKEGKTAAVAPGKNAALPATPRFPGRAFSGSNAPLRAGKGTTFEGGVRVPLIAWRPGTIGPGREVAAPISHLDLFPTFVHLAQCTLPSDRVYDGRDLGAKLDATGEAARPLFYYFGYQLQAVREGKWKLFLVVDKKPEPRPKSLWYEHLPQVFETQHRLLAQPALYDLDTDLGETRNVAGEHPDLVARLTRLAHEFDLALQRDRRPMEFVDGPKPPAPQTVRTPEADLSAWQEAQPAKGQRPDR